MKNNIWSEIRSSFMMDNFIFIDAWLTEDDNEEGKVIAKIDVKKREVIYLDDRAKFDPNAQEIICEELCTVNQLARYRN